jgi:hypothetical protein
VARAVATSDLGTGSPLGQQARDCRLLGGQLDLDGAMIVELLSAAAGEHSRKPQSWFIPIDSSPNHGRHPAGVPSRNQDRLVTAHRHIFARPERVETHLLQDARL